MKKAVSLEELLEAGAHFGHQSRRWNPKMAPYLYGVVEGIHIFDLPKTKAALEEALGALTEAASAGKVILLLGTKKQVKDKIIEVGQATDCPYVSERWLGGTLTNFEQMKRTIERFLGGISSLKALPDVLFVVDTHKEKGAIKEAVKSKIETVGIVDSNADPMVVDYPIPMNDDASKALSYVLDLVKEAILEGKKKIKPAPETK